MMIEPYEDPMAERRRYPRIDLQLPLRYRVLTRLGDAPPASEVQPGAGATQQTTRNLGIGGLCIGADKPLPGGTILELELSLPSDGDEFLVRMVGRVAWCRPAAGGQSPHEVGVELVSVSEDHLHRLIWYVTEYYANKYRLHDEQQRKAFTDLLQKLLAVTAREARVRNDPAL